MKKEKICKHCLEVFEARRSNHVYCNTSCKTKASYERNNYKYVSGHYQKQEVSKDSGELNVPENSNIIASIKSLEWKIDSIQKASDSNRVSVTKSALGSVAGDVAVYGVKKVFAPNTLPATKGDVIALKNELNELKRMIQSLNINKIQFL